MKNSVASSVLLVLCVDAAFAQFNGPQTQQFDLTRQRVLSPQQQGHILSDIQQHHRFNPQPSFPPTQFGQRQQPFNQNFQQLRPTQQNVINGQQNIFPTQQNLLNQNALSSQQIVPTNQALVNLDQTQLISQGFQPTAPTLNRPIVQHHTQTSFTPNFNQQAAQQFSQFSVGQNAQGTLDPEKQKQRLLELKEKQAIIDKHNQFVEKQYEKALKKAQAEHQEFIENQKEEKKKLYQSLYTNGGFDNFRFSHTQPRYIYPEETELFKQAVKKYYEEHPTTTTTTTTTTTPKPTTQKTRRTTPKTSKDLDDPEQFLSSKDFKSVTEESQSAASSSLGKVSFLPTVLPTRKSIQSLEELNLLQKQYKTQQIKKDDLLAQLRLAIGETGADSLTKNITSREISLPNGQRVEIIRTTDPKLVPGAKPLDLEALGLKPQGNKPFDLESLGLTAEGNKALDLEALGLKPQDEALGSKPQVSTTTARPANEVLEELTKGVLPPGANFELLKQGSGGLETVGGLPQNLPNQKKVTFVLLEEQNDGSFKVQGVKGNAKDKADVDVDSILKKIKEGEIKLPPNTKLQGSTALPTTTTESSVSSTERKTTMEIVSSVSIQPNSVPPQEEDFASTPILKTNIGTQFIASPTPSIPSSTYYSTTNEIFSTTPSPKPSPSPSPRSINAQDYDSIRLSSSNDLIRQASTSSTINKNSLFSPQPTSPTFSSTNPTFSSTFSSTFPNPTNSVTIVKSHSTVLPTISSTPQEEEDDLQQELPEVLKKNGLYAMARFLKQSGLDTILNETGPYTVFVPTDKAFRTLLVQLGGPEKAEEKFKENPRLLSGLLLHHVIPGAFKIESLQDEMTGVSLAGTQLRVNQYNMHDLEWNDIKITTINGAKIMDDKKDIDIPQGVAHSIDRVMFPLPVGDIVQTLQSDRERRFTSFLRALFASGLAETLQGTKTFTLFAPTDKAFSGLTSEDLTRTVSDRTLSRELVMRHLTPGTLYTNGMRYYQIRDSLEANRQITLSKSSGRIKVNNNQIITQNIPATNGVIHALDTLL